MDYYRTEQQQSWQIERYRGKMNHPVYVRYVAEFLAALRNEPLEKIAEQTTENYLALFVRGIRSKP